MTEASDVFSLGATLYTCIEGQPPFGMEDNALAMLHKVAGGQIVPPRRAGSLTRPLTRMLAADPADRPEMPEVRDELAKLAAGRNGDTTTVLLARTDLGSNAPGRNRTTAFPADGASANSTATPVPPPPTSVNPPPTRTDTRERETADPPAAAPVHATPPAAVAVAPQRADVRPPREAGRRRGRALWMLAGVVVAVLAGLIVFWAIALDGDGSDPSDAAGATTTSAEPTDEAEETTAEQSSPSTGQSSTSSESEPAAAGDPAQAATNFFALIPDDLDAAYQLTSPEFQANTPFGNFSGFWDDFSSVQIGNVRAEDDTTALVDITYVRPDGSSETEPHRIRFVAGDDGRLLLLDDRIA
jgi:outer membrane biosynthesis protein TonB